jgi:hypothetical protein
MFSIRLPRLHLAMSLALAALAPSRLPAADAPQIRELRGQRVNDVTYFHVRFDAPDEMYVPRIEQWQWSERQRRLLARIPQLVSQDGKAHAVYTRVALPDYLPRVGFSSEPVREPVPVKGLEFVGKVQGDGWAKFLLQYSTDKSEPRPPKIGDTQPPDGWSQVALELNFANAQAVPFPADLGKRRPSQPAARDDLEGLWASAQAGRLAVLEALAPDFSFYGFACAATERKYGVHAPMLERGPVKDREHMHRRMYEMTTGASAITESLQLHRMLHAEGRDKGERTIDVATVRGIDIAQHPWKKMMADKVPLPEPLAKLVPHDNFYIHFKSIRKFIEFGELLDQWGTNVIRGYEINSRDYNLNERYEKQLCLRGSWLGKTFGPAVVKSLAVTGSDGYLREGTDLTVLFHVTDAKAFLAGVEQFIRQARKEFGEQLTESRSVYHDIVIESIVTPLREVSLHRAVIGDFVIYSNSLVGLRRVLDTHLGWHKALADSLDFQYMRTVFTLSDDLEDGFAFLSDAFIRQLVGPVSKIKEKRRLEALTSLAMVTNAAMFTGWETGKHPSDHAALLRASALKPEEIYTPEGKGVTWDAARQTAVSDVYNTIHFATPLLELPVDKITPTEKQEYDGFRTEYLSLWRKYFDPVGMRISLSDRRVRVETYILPLIQSEHYAFLRQWAGDGTADFDTARLAPTTVIQGTVHLGNQLKGLAGDFLVPGAKVGNWFFVGLDDDAVFNKLASIWVHQEFDPRSYTDLERQTTSMLEEFPVTLGLQVKVKDAAVMGKLTKDVAERFNFTHEELTPYQGVPILGLRGEALPHAVLYHALVDDVWCLSLKEASLKAMIDHSRARRDGKALPQTEKPISINGSVYLAPSAAKKAEEGVGYYLEWASHRRALVNGPIWYALYRAGLIDAKAPENVQRTVAERFLGFVPVSPDGAAYGYDVAADEVVNQRHGSIRQPRWHGRIEATSPLGKLLEQFPRLRADLRFQEDGINTTVTIERRK